MTRANTSLLRLCGRGPRAPFRLFAANSFTRAHQELEHKGVKHGAVQWVLPVLAFAFVVENCGLIANHLGAEAAFWAEGNEVTHFTLVVYQQQNLYACVTGQPIKQR